MMGLFDSFVDLLSDYLSDFLLFGEDLGSYGERLTERELKKANNRGFEGKILRNLYVPKDNGDTSEIDVVYICKKGILVIESKNYSGWIFGNEDDSKWTATLPNGQKNHFYNPIYQNKAHIKWLGNYIQGICEIIRMYSIIAFSERCTLKNITIHSPQVFVLNRDRIKYAIREIWNNDDCLEETDVEKIYEKLAPLTNVDEAKKQAHVESIKSVYGPKWQANSEISMPAMESMVFKALGIKMPKSSLKTCPKCGSPLVLRTAKKGTNAGKQFWGCSGFPNCRYVESKD